MSHEMDFVLPYPKKISVNNCWKRSKKGVFLNPAATRYRRDVFYLVHKLPRFGKDLVRIEIKMYPPDKRVRDIDNICKSVCDALQYAEVYENDSQIMQLYIEKGEVKKGGELHVKIKSLEWEDSSGEDIEC